MKRIFVTAGLTLMLASIFAVPLVSSAALVPCQGPECQACHLSEMANRIIDFLIMLGVGIAILMFMWAGFEMITAQGNQSKLKHAKEVFKDVFVGIVITLIAWLIIDLAMQLTVGGELEVGPWNTIQCVEQPQIQAIPNAAGGGVAPTDPGGNQPGATPEQGGLVPGAFSNIASAMSAYVGASTAAGPDGGNLACAWAVNNVLAGAGIAPLDANYVPAMESALQGGRGTLVTQSAAQPGDIVIQGNAGHVGICQNVGCTSVVSNSSSQAKFNWVSGPNMGSTLPPRIYRVTN